MTELKPIEQKQIAFQGSQVTAVMVQDENGRENVYIPLKHLVEGMGLNWSAQRKRINRNPVLTNVCTNVVVTTTEQNRSRNIEMLCIPISHLNGFLFGVNANRVKSEIRPLLVEYQAKCYEVLFNAFNGTESMRRFYSAIGHEDGWIGRRIAKHNFGTDLADLWLLNGIPIEKHDQLQDIINKGTFGLTIAEHKKHKNIPNDVSLHDNMSRVELLIAALADEAAIIISEREEPQTYSDNKKIAHVAGETGSLLIDDFEQKTGGKVLSDKNHLDKKRPLLDEGK